MLVQVDQHPAQVDRCRSRWTGVGSSSSTEWPTCVSVSRRSVNGAACLDGHSRPRICSHVISK